MKKSIIISVVKSPLSYAILLVALIFTMMYPTQSSAQEIPILFKTETRVPVDSEIDPWDLFSIKDGKIKCKWITKSAVVCPKGGRDFHIILVNPDPKAEINGIELVVGDGGLTPLGSLLWYTCIKDGKRFTFHYDYGKKRYTSLITFREGETK